MASDEIAYVPVLQGKLLSTSAAKSIGRMKNFNFKEMVAIFKMETIFKMINLN